MMAAHYRWQNSEWIFFEQNPDKFGFWAIVIRDPDTRKVTNSRITTSKVGTPNAAAQNTYGIPITPNMTAYYMTSRVSEMRKLMRRLPN